MVAGVDTRPADIRCSNCKHEFTLSKKIIKVEIECPACDRGLRITQRPGERKLRCPACMEIFKLGFDPFLLIFSKIALSRMLGTVDINYH